MRMPAGSPSGFMKLCSSVARPSAASSTIRARCANPARIDGDQVDRAVRELPRRGPHHPGGVREIAVRFQTSVRRSEARKSGSVKMAPKFSKKSLPALITSVPFTLTVDDLAGSANNGSFAMALFGIGSATTTHYISSPWDGHTTYSGRLSVSADLIDDTSTWISATTWASLQGSPVLPPVAAPVPEPASVAMMMAGVSVVGFAARRRKRVTPD